MCDRATVRRRQNPKSDDGGGHGRS